MKIEFNAFEYIEVEDGHLTSTLVHGRKNSRWAAACDTLESMILALACAGCSQEIMQEAAITTMDAMANNLGD